MNVGRASLRRFASYLSDTLNTNLKYMIRQRSIVSLLLILAAAAPAATAQVSREVRLPTRTDTLVARYGTTIIGRGITARAYRGGELQQAYVWQSAADGSSTTDSLWLDTMSVQPWREVRVISDTAVRITFGKGRVDVRTIVAGRETSRRGISAPTPYHSSASLEVIAASMQMQVGATADVNAYYAPPSNLGFQVIRLRVVARDTVRGTDAWRVVASTPTGSTTFWISATSREVLQYDVREGAALITFRR